MMSYKKIFIILLFVILLVFPLATFSQVACRELEVPIPGLSTTCLPALPDYIMAIFRFSLMIIGIIVFGALLYGGFRYLTSAGRPAAIADAKDQIFSALLGLIILFSSWLILNTINPELVILSQPGVQGCASDADCDAGQVCVAGICSVYPAGGAGTISDYPSWSRCSSYVTSGECTNANCTWCPRCSGTSRNTWGFDTCVEPGTDCGYTCVVGECGAESCS